MLSGAGYSCITSTMDPREVCELHRKNRYDLILLDLLMSGMDGFQIAEDLSLSSKTISTYRARVLEKLGVKNSAEITQYAIRNGLVM